MWQDETVLEAANSALTEAHLQHLSVSLHQSPTVVQNTFARLVALVIRSLQDRVRKPNGEEALWTLTRQAQEAKLLPTLSTLDPHTHRGRNLMQGLLGERYADTTRQLASTAALPAAAFDHLLEVAVAAVLGTLGQRATDQQLDAPALSQWLQQQPRSANPAPLPQAKPAALRPDSDKETIQRFTVAGAGTWEKVGGGITFTPGSGAPRKSSKVPGWVWLLVPLAGLGYLGGQMLGGPGQSAIQPGQSYPAGTPAMSVANVVLPTEAARTAAPPTLAPSSELGSSNAAAMPYTPLPNPEGYTTGHALLLTLPNGSRQRVTAHSTEYRLYRYLTDPTQQADSLHPTAGWLSADRVYFTPGKATLTRESQEQLRRLAAILKAFPQAQIKLASHAAPTGDEQANQQLSQQRARAAMYALSALGVARSRLLTAGYGTQALSATHASPTGLALNQLSMQVLNRAIAAAVPVKAREAAASGRRPVAYTTPAKPGKARELRPRRTKVGRWLQRLGTRMRKKRPRKAKSHAFMLFGPPAGCRPISGTGKAPMRPTEVSICTA
ncbi:OmpA family protein [Hymenobacter sp. BT635]|uniref:OmpA family protein n=1 Tax=Hymenobacter nitidus TaxID=2880929 RepID=A0ABS8AFX7_9BACT|nr:OmpA family protein [Hymenobacter nitidus]MCB2379328.1 OmpA family protein [Hymenobacter nitidus]